MQNIIKRTTIVTIAIALYIAGVLIVLPMLMPKKGDIIRIDCTWSEISPDFSPEIKNACRKARMANPT
jgi:hypothetical protein